MTRKRVAAVLTISALLIIAWSLQASAYMQPMPGPLGPPMPMPVKVGPAKCLAPPPTCMPQLCGPTVCQPPTCAPPSCPPPVCAPPQCAPPMCGPPMFGMDCGGGGPFDSLRGCLTTVLGVIGAPFRLLDNVLCAQKKPCCPPPICCPPPPCGPIACGPPPKVSKKFRPRHANMPGFVQ